MQQCRYRYVVYGVRRDSFDGAKNIGRHIDERYIKINDDIRDRRNIISAKYRYNSNLDYSNFFLAP